MLKPEIIAAIAVNAVERNNRKYVVMVDNSRFGTSEESQVAFGTVILTTNNEEKAIRTANFWDERMNTHMVTIDENTFQEAGKYWNRKKTVHELVTNNLTVAHNVDYFDSLTAQDKLKLRVEAAQARIGASFA